MLHETVRNGLMLVLSILAGVVAGSTARAFVGDDGILQPSIMAAQSPVAALGVVGLAALVAAACGLGMARIANPAVGLFVGGWAFFALAWRMEPVEPTVLAGGSVMGLAVEVVIWAALAGLAWTLILRLSGGLPDVEPTVQGERPHPILSGDAARMALASLAALPAAWLLARTAEPGQVIAAAVAGGLAAGLAGRLAAPHVQPYLLVSTTILAGGLGMAGFGMMLGADLEAAARTRGLPPLVSIHGGAWAAGSMIGVAMGLGWAKSFLHHEDQPAEASAPARRRVVPVSAPGTDASS